MKILLQQKIAKQYYYHYLFYFSFLSIRFIFNCARERYQFIWT